MNKANFIEMKQSPEDIQQLISYAKSPNGFLLLSGSNGSGKSYAAEAIYRMNTPYQLPAYDPDLALFITQAELNEEWFDIDSRKAISSKYKKTKLLILDDLGTKRPSDAFGDFLYALIDYRWKLRDELGTIITTNLNSQGVREVFGSAIISRIASGIVKRWDHPDRRAKEF